MSSQAVATEPQADREVVERFVRHRGPVTCVTGIPGRRAALSSGYDSAVAWVDLENRTLELLGYHDHLVNTVVVDGSGSRAASSSSDHTICIWDLETRRPRRILRGHGDDVNDFAFVDDATGASVSHDHRVYVWDLDTGAVRRILEGHDKYAMSVDCAGGKIYSSGDDMTMRQWDAATGELLKQWGPFEVETDTCAIDARHGRIVLGADDGCVRVFDDATGALVREIPAHSSGIKKVAVSPATGDILSAGYDQRLLVWDAETFERKIELEPNPTAWERSLNWMPDGREILAGTFEGTVLVWDAASGKCLAEIGAGDDVRGNACFNDVSANEAGELALVSDDGYVRLARLAPERAQLVARLEPAAGRVLMNAVTLDDRSGLVACGAHDQKLHLFRRMSGTLAGEVEVKIGEGPINCVRIAHHPGFEDHAFVGCYSGAVVRVSPAGEILGRYRLNEGAVKALRIHPTRPIGISAGADGGMVSWTLEGEPLRHFRGHTAIANDVDLDPTGTLVGSVSRDFSLKVYELESGRLIHAVPLGRRSLKSVCFWDPDTVFVGNYWGRLSRCDLRGHKTSHAQIAGNGLSSLSRAGEYLVAASYDGGAYLVRPDDLTVVSTLRTMVQKVPGALLVREASAG